MRASLGGDVIGQTAHAMAAAVADRAISASEIVRAHLEQIERRNPALNAICTVNPRAEAAAAECDRRIASGMPARPLEGVPFVAKDVLHTAGLRTTFGSKLLEHLVPTEDAISVERLKAAGAVLIGKTNTPEFAHDTNTTNALFGATRNPWAIDFSAGGSSGGTAAAIAAAMAPIGLGTDLGGSIRTPASFCGIVGLRPAPGRVPIYPSDFAWDTLVAHVQGPMAASTTDIGLMLSVLAGPDDRDPISIPLQDVDYVAAARVPRRFPPSGVRRIAYTPDLGGLFPVDPEVAALTRAAARRFEALGWRVDDECFDASDVPEIVAGTRAFCMTARYAERVERERAAMTPALIAQVSAASQTDLRAVARAERLRTQYWHRVRRFFHAYDHIMLPVAGVAGFRLDGSAPATIGGTPIARFYDVFFATYAFSLVGMPAISIPCGWTNDGLPVGLQIVGPRLREDRVLEAAAAYAALCPEHGARARTIPILG